ncbi:MAG TPA: prepilin-type N-terminal cleavage/methylation domain-containing protein, partial [Longimicrobiales bacterium]|nr:prepilin-type N-terminal cleavage/methylation domain-containing protein [Longimicrobiales bacterium]
GGAMMLKARKGFTLIELLIVVVIIGVLAAIAIPKFSKSRERAYFSAMRSDLRNLATAEEIYYSANSQYTNTLSNMADFTLSKDVSISVGDPSSIGYYANATHNLAASGKGCSIFYGTASGQPSWLTTPGVVACTGE